MSLKNLVGISLDVVTPSKETVQTDYSGDLIPESALAECLSQAESLYKNTINWLGKNKQELA